MLSVRLNNQAGDTIVEVLIAIAVASSVLGIVFATSARNLRTTRDIQERGEATRLVQGQIEALRFAINKGTTLPAGGAPFCMNGGTPITGFIGTVPAATLDGENFSNYPAACKSGFYNYVIVQDALAVGTYRFYTRWDSLTETGRDQVIMVYKN